MKKNRHPALNKNNQKQKTKPDAPVPTAEQEAAIHKRDLTRVTPVVCIVLFGVIVWALLYFCYPFYMQKVESLSLFLSTGTFLKSHLSVPGGLILWCSTFLNQLLIIPWLGALIYALLLVAIYIVGNRALQIPRQLWPAAVTGPVMLLLAFTNLGYLIFSLKPVGFVFSLPLGILCSLLIYWLYRRASNQIVRLAMMIAIVAVGYWVMGFYGLFVGCLCSLGTITEKRARWWWMRFVTLALFAIMAWYLPRWWFYHIDSDLIYSQMYISGLPRFYAMEWGWRVYYAVIFALYILLAAFMSWFGKRAVTIPSVCAPAIYALAIAALFCFRYSDRNFMLTLRLDRYIWQQQWDKAELAALEFDDQPTRINTVLAYIAMMRTGDAGDRMFAVYDSKAPYRTTRDISAFNDAVGPLVAYQLGLINYANRWATEYTIGQGASVERLKILTKCALLNYEFDLAGTYLDILYNTPFHRQWARKYKRYQSKPMEMASDNELRAIKQLMCHQNEFINDGGAFESYVWPHLASTQSGTPAFNELAMQAALVNRDLDTFIAKLGEYAINHPRVPRYYQEAALLWSLMQKQPCPIKIETAIETAHNGFLNMFRSTSHGEAENQRELMRPTYGDTYWFYFVFNDDMLLK